MVNAETLRLDNLGSTDKWQLIAVKLPNGVYSEHELIAHQLPAKIGKLPGRLLFPGPTKGTGIALTSPPGPPAWRGHPEYSSIEQDWGYRNSESRATIRSVGLYIEQTEFEDGEPTYPPGFLRAARVWVSQLADWLSVLAQGATDVAGGYALTWENWNIEVEALQEGMREWLEPKHPLTREQWKFALKKVSLGESAPFPLALIYASQRSAAEGDYRRAVFDAASAAETVLRKALKSHLAQTQVASGDYFEWTTRRQTFGPLVEMCRKFGLQTPDDVMGRLVQVRNKVAHPSDPPSDDEMMNAICVASQIVKAHYPIPPDLQGAISGGTPTAQ